VALDVVFAGVVVFLVLVFAAESVFAESDVLPPEGWAHACAAEAAISAPAIANNRKRKVVCIMFRPGEPPQEFLLLSNCITGD
jgi:hypothetical protein